MKYTDLFIDFDDTLYDTQGNGRIALKEVYDSMHFHDLGVDEKKFYSEYIKANIDLWGRYAKEEITRDYLIVERFRKPLCESRVESRESRDETWPSEEFCLKVSDTFLDFCSCKPGVVEGAHELMDYLRDKGYRMHICSNGFHEVQYKKLKACGLIDYFDTIILSEDAGVNKPQKAFFDYALKTAGAERETTLMVGDNCYSDIIGALDSGIDAMLFNRWDPTFVPPRNVTYIVNTLNDISNIL